MEILYHVSPTPGLTILVPHLSSHSKPYVYAIDDLTTGLLFGAKKDDFDLLIFTGGDGVPSVYECYPDAFQHIYAGKSCSVYEVSGETFQRGMTSWAPELVSEYAVPVLQEITVTDLYDALLEQKARGKLHLHPYGYAPEYRALITRELVARIVRFDPELTGFTQTDPRFTTHFNRLVTALREVMDGHLLG